MYQKKRKEKYTMNYKIIIMGVLALTLFPKNTWALEEKDKEDYKIVAQTEKYYKTTTDLYNLTREYNNTTSEISKEEYDSYKEPVTRGNGTSETTYKKLTTSILSNGSRYRYQATLTWKNFPAVRSYDVIGIGHYSNVKYDSNLNFYQTYCLSGGGCRTLTTYYPKTTSTGVGAVFKVPTGTLSSLNQTIYFDVTKNVNATINSQAAYGDYSHATETVNENQAQNYSIGTSGIIFSNGIGNYYDNIAPAMATWNGTW